jgi:hypothetical protein
MAVPSAVLRQRERLEAELGMKADGTPLTPLPETPPVVDPPAAIESQPEPLTAAQTRIQELEHLLETQNGRTSVSMREANEAKERADALASQVAALQESVAELQRQKETAEAQAAATLAGSSLPSFEVEDVTPEEVQKFDADSVGFINKLSKKQLVAYVKPLVDKVAALEKVVARVSELDKLPQLERVVKDSQAETQRVKEAEFFRNEVLAYFPDFEKIRETQAWKDYLAADIPERGIKNQHLLAQYRAAQNAPAIRSFIQAHYDQQKAKPSLGSLATPRGTQTEGTPTVKPRMKASDYNAKLRLFINKRIPKEEWEPYKSEFLRAMAENRVDQDARL